MNCTVCKKDIAVLECCNISFCLYHFYTTVHSQHYNKSKVLNREEFEKQKIEIHPIIESIKIELEKELKIAYSNTILGPQKEIRKDIRLNDEVMWDLDLFDKPKETSKPIKSKEKPKITKPLPNKNIIAPIDLTKDVRPQIIERINVALHEREEGDYLEKSKLIEEELFKKFGETPEYNSQYRAIIFNIRDKTNQTFYRNIMSGKISPEALPNLSPYDMKDETTRDEYKKEILKNFKKLGGDNTTNKYSCPRCNNSENNTFKYLRTARDNPKAETWGNKDDMGTIIEVTCSKCTSDWKIEI